MNPNAVYLIGIGGIGMSALARYYKHYGFFVAGYDRIKSTLTQELESENIYIHYEDNIALIPENCKNAEHTLIIYTPAVPKEHSELNYFTSNNFNIVKRSKALGLIANDKHTFAIAGTHGKTSTSSLLAHILTVAADGCNAFLGGISKNYNSNLLLSQSNNLVAEADEFDRSFLQLFPDAAVVTATDADHLDIYGNIDAMRNAFGKFVSQIKSGGTLIIKKGIEIDLPKSNINIYTYSCSEPCDFYASDIKPCNDGCYVFDINLPDKKIRNCKLGVPGLINVENAIAATALAWTVGIDEQKLKNALTDFTGVKRRMDVKINTPKLTYIDDYAHHPEELKATITSIRNMFTGRKITAIFQPHLYTRTRDFADGFAESLSLADELILLDIYPARELPIDGITSKIIFDKVQCREKILCKKNELMNIVSSKKFDILLTLGAGDIDLFVEPITKMLNEKLNLETKICHE
ncbi:MAG: UDP-N-acetylmuramate--L-alanine ligase [Prevotellaceae bacterium]|jgi:UDP-N-acetylmuramate--alanine ligase|nr:UDP-N-acetylmuramate--L-alanine ligase [Prevotellaceae bacterium]